MTHFGLLTQIFLSTTKMP